MILLPVAYDATLVLTKPKGSNAMDRPSPWHHALTVELRRLRKNAGITREQVAEQLEWYGSKVTRIETGNWKRLHPRDIRDMLALYGVTEKQDQERYVRLAKRARERNWWNDYPDAVDYTAFENEATAIQTFEPCYVSGLLQTEEYARAAIRANPALELDEAERRVELRMERQQQRLLDREGPQFRAIIDEAVIRRPVGDRKVMADQLRHIIEATASTQRVNVQVLPFSAGAHPGMDGSFVILRFADPLERPVVYLETSYDGVYPEGDQMIEWYTLIFEHLLAMALSPRDSVALMEDVMHEFQVRA